MRVVLWIIYKTISLAMCRGKHEYKKVRVFEVDPKGREVEAIFGGTFRGRWLEFKRCWHCRLREDGKGFDY